MKSLYIENMINQHYETLESVIVKHREIIGDVDIDQIYLNCLFDKMTGFKEYIMHRFPDIIIDTPDDYNYRINCTVYPCDHYKIVNDQDSKTDFYICHRTKRFDGWSNVVYCLPTPTNKHIVFDQLPFMNQPKAQLDKPVFIIQGRPSARSHQLLAEMLRDNMNFDFKILIIGKGVVPQELSELISESNNKISIQTRLDFRGYHEQFLRATHLLPMITKHEHPSYYHDCLTSSINYASAYNLHCMLDNELQQIYHIDNASVYRDSEQLNNMFRSIVS